MHGPFRPAPRRGRGWLPVARPLFPPSPTVCSHNWRVVYMYILFKTSISRSTALKRPVAASKALRAGLQARIQAVGELDVGLLPDPVRGRGLEDGRQLGRRQVAHNLARVGCGHGEDEAGATHEVRGDDRAGGAGARVGRVGRCRLGVGQDAGQEEAVGQLDGRIALNEALAHGVVSQHALRVEGAPGAAGDGGAGAVRPAQLVCVLWVAWR